MIELPYPENPGTDMVKGLDQRPVPRLASVATAPGCILMLTWADGTAARVDLTGWIEGPGLPLVRRLRDPVTFGRVAIIDYGSALQWDGDDSLTIDAVQLEMLAEQQADFSPSDLVAWQERHGLSNSEAADMLDVHPNTWVNYRRQGAKVPRPVSIALRAMDRDPVTFAAYYRPR